MTIQSSDRKPLLQVHLRFSDSTHTLAALVDSGAEANIMDIKLARQLGLENHRLTPPIPARALDGHLLGSVTHVTAPVSMSLSGNYPVSPAPLSRPTPHPGLPMAPPAQPSARLGDQGLGRGLPPNLPACLLPHYPLGQYPPTPLLTSPMSQNATMVSEKCLTQ